MIKVKNCSNCGAENEENSNFCKRCGFSLKSNLSPPPPPPPTQSQGSKVISVQEAQIIVMEILQRLKAKNIVVTQTQLTETVPKLWVFNGYYEYVTQKALKHPIYRMTVIPEKTERKIFVVKITADGAKTVEVIT
jgi:predicted amidophosphoribosyltransferase